MQCNVGITILSRELGEMKTKREEDESMEEEENSKRQKLLDEQSSSPSPSPPRLGFDNALLPLATYDDEEEEEEEEDEMRGAGGDRFRNGDGRIAKNGYRDGSEDDDEDDDGNAEKGLSGGKSNRVVELRRDCPYLDTVNRQVLYLSVSQFCSSLSCHFFGFCGRSLFGKSSNISFCSELNMGYQCRSQ